jgi:hypothetical protein
MDEPNGTWCLPLSCAFAAPGISENAGLTAAEHTGIYYQTDGRSLD